MPYVQVWVDSNDALEDASDEDLRDEYMRRFSTDNGDPDLLEAIARIERGDIEYGLHLLRQIADPKFDSLEDCLKAYARARKAVP